MIETVATLDRRALLHESEERLEPAWLRSLRREALGLFEKQSWPERTNENWRFTDYRRLVPETLGGEATVIAVPAAPEVDLSGVVRKLEPGASSTGSLGSVEVSPFLEAVRTEEVSLRRFLEETEAHVVDRFDSLALASFDEGVFLQVKDGSQVDPPVAVRLEPRLGPDGWQSTLSYISLGAHSKGSLVVDFPPSKGGRVTCGSDHLHVEVGDGADWDILFLQRLSGADNRLQRLRLSVGSGSHVRLFRLDWGGAVVKTEARLVFRGTASELEWRGAYLLSGDQRFELNTLQDHVVGDDVSNLLVKGVLGQRAHAVYRGLIRILPGAQRSNAYQANKNLLLSANAHVHSIPMLEIEANDVRCSHGSASGPIDSDQVFYLQSRGLPEAEARRMIIKGFVGELLDGGMQEPLRNALEGPVEARVDQLLLD